MRAPPSPPPSRRAQSRGRFRRRGLAKAGIILLLFAEGAGVKPRISVTRHDRAVNYRVTNCLARGMFSPAGLAVKLIHAALRGICCAGCVRTVNNPEDRIAEIEIEMLFLINNIWSPIRIWNTLIISNNAH